MIVYDQHEQIGKWVAEKTDGEYREGGKAIGIVRDGNIVAGVLYDNFNGASVYAHIAVEHGAYIGKEFLHAIFDYPFNQLGANVIIGLVAQDNIRAQELDEHLGFTLKYILPEGHPSGGLFHYAMYKTECRWINGKS